MPKRKRDHVAPTEPEQPGHLNQRQRVEVGKKLAHGKKRLNQALKTARAFERQKLAKRMRNAADGQDGNHNARLEKELEIVKGLDLPAVAEAHLHKTLSKIKGLPEAVSSIPDIRNPINEDLSGDAEDNARRNVLARLYNTKHVKSELSVVIEGLGIVLGMNTSGGRSERRQQPDLGQHEVDKEALDVPDTPMDDCMVNDKFLDSAAQYEGRRRQSPPPGENVATKAGQDDGEESASTSSREITPHNISKSANTVDLRSRKAAYDPAADLSLSPSESESRSSTPPPSKIQKSSKKSTAPGDSAFLPSLMMSGYWSGSESAEDSIAEEEPRKNRRGQRARQQIWEKKYGKTANHLKKGARDNGWDPQRGANDGRGSKGRHQGAPWKGVIQGNGGSGDARPGTGANSIENPTTKEKKADNSDKPLHPSWIAAKKAKEQKQTPAFQGKRVVFD